MTTILGDVCRHFEPRPHVRAVRWFIAHAETDLGRPYDHDAYPHLGAPGGPCDALDDPQVRSIAMQFGSRLGKTAFGQWALQFFASTAPAPMMMCGPGEKLALQVMGRQYKMLEQNRLFRDRLQPEHLRKDEEVVLPECNIYLAWARSPATLSDKPIRWGHMFELDKCDRTSNSTEADPEKLFDERFKEFSRHKRIKESTPSVKGRSRIERLVTCSTNCRFHVPCPHCKKYQILKFGDGKSPGAVRWKRAPGGKHDVPLARATGYYECAHCQKKIEDHHRAPMMRRGVWCPEGATVNHAKAWKLTSLVKLTGANGGDGASQQDYLREHYQWSGWSEASWIDGHPVRDSHEAGYQLSSLYALTLGWGDIAAQFIDVKDKPAELQNFINSWLGETWEIRSRQQTWQELGARLIGEVPRSICPRWASFVTVGIDRQADRFVYAVDAWGPERANATIEYGELETFDELRNQVLDRGYTHEDGGAPLVPVMTLIDSGFSPDGVYEFCVECLRAGRQVWPSKGSSKNLNADYRVTTLDDNTSMPGMKLVWLDTIRSQGWLDRQLHVLQRSDPGASSLHAGSLEQHQDFLEQLLNDGATMELDKANNARQKWERLVTSIPNDFRDCRRGAYVAMLLHTRGAPIRPRSAPPAKRRAVVNPGATRPDGRPWL
jgi:phage terminase large subunit GpA-like protein